MKKGFLSLFLLVSIFCLAACATTDTATTESSSTQEVVETQLTAVIAITVNDQTNTTEVTFSEGDSLMAVLKDNFEIKETSGLVTAIDGVSQDEAKGLYWMYDINGQMAEVGVSDYELQDGDLIEFYQVVYE